MFAEMIIGLSITLLVAFVMIGLGISQLKSKYPVGFYTGEKPPAPNQLSNVAAWNRKHGQMWILFGIIIIFSYVAPLLFVGMESECFPVLYCAGIVMPIPVMMWYHGKLNKIYKLPDEKVSR